MYYDRRALVPGPPYASLHAKCVVVDGAQTFISSANFTQRAQERNIEVGVLIEDAASGRKAFYAPGFGAMEPHLEPFLADSDCVLLDGTFWTDDEMIRLGLSKKTAHDIGHLAQSSAGGMIEWLSRLPASTRKVLIHINNTNPILDASSAERRVLDAAGIEVSFDGLEVEF